jgi:hypothetical protein
VKSHLKNVKGTAMIAQKSEEKKHIGNPREKRGRVSTVNAILPPANPHKYWGQKCDFGELVLNYQIVCFDKLSVDIFYLKGRGK